ncbi:hypothetical protein [Actinomadura sp. 3N508]|uniref:hypothetical protein n=1 Tax=Actinomadura sp. 3N508 TaxID=3375153 RepID=UPI0037B35125
MLFVIKAVISASAYYFEAVHKILLSIGVVAVVAVLVVGRIVVVRRRARKGRR